MISRIGEEIHTFNRAQDVVRKPLVYSAHCGTGWSQGKHSNSAHETSSAVYAQGGGGGGWGGGGGGGGCTEWMLH